MTIIVINPNSTSGMTDAMLDQAKSAAPSLDFEGWTSTNGPASIQGPKDGAAATAPLLDLVDRAAAQKASGIIIGCFDDTALAHAAAIAPCPVIGIGQASYHYAALRQWSFSVVTTMAISVPILEANIQTLGLAPYLARVRASDVPVLDLEDDATAASTRIIAEARAAAEQDSIDAIILGCAGMVNVVQQVRDQIDLPIIDPVTCAAQAMMWLTQKA